MHTEGRFICFICVDIEILIGVFYYFIIHNVLQLSCILVSILLNLCFVFRLLWIVDREFSHEKVTRVLPLAIPAEVEVLSDLKSRSLVSDETIGKQDKAITVGEGLRTGLMNRRNDSLVFLPSELRECPTDPLCGKAIQARRWLVEKHDLRVSNQLDTDSCSFPFASRDSLL